MFQHFALYALIIILYGANVSAQVPNGDFELWENGVPLGWSTFNFTNPPAITQSTDSHGGSFAVRGETFTTSTGIIIPIIITGLIGGHGFPISEKYTALTGYYKLMSINNENLSVVVAAYKNGSAIGVGGLQFFAAAEYTQFTVPIFYSNEEIPDSCQISITIGNNSNQVSAGSYFIIDDLSFQLTTGIDEINNSLSLAKFVLNQNYPNPYNPATNISYSLKEKSFITLKVYNIMGKEIAVLVNGEKEAGEYTINFNAEDLPAGIYFYTLGTKNFRETKKMTLLK